MLKQVAETDPQDSQRVPTPRAQTETSDMLTPLAGEGALAETSDMLSPLEEGSASSSPSGSGMGRDDPLLPDGSRLELEGGAELEVMRVLGRGGMGVVYLVHDPRLQRQAALKLVRDSSNERRARRFRREAEITAHLDHPGIPPVFERGKTASGQDYLLLRYVEGKSLGERLEALPEKRQAAKRRGEAYPVPRALLEALARVGEAVAYAHSRGIVHRDLKPDNVMLGSFGEVLLMDWGLARDFREDADSAFMAKSDPGDTPNDGPLLGTLGYMAPEQARREDVDARADVYGLGAILTELLCGEPPVRLAGSTALDVLEHTRGGRVQGPAAREPRVPPELDAIARAAIAPERSKRYGTAEAFSSDLRAYLAGRRVSVYDYRVRERLVRGIKRHSTWVVAIAFLVITLLAVLQARVTERRAQVDEARLEAARMWATLRETHPADRDEWLSRAWGALTAAQQWLRLDPEGEDAAQACFRAAFALGDSALSERQWSLARQAYMQAVGLGVDDERATHAVERVDAALTEAQAASRAAVHELFARVVLGESGGRERLLELALDLVREASVLSDLDPLYERLDAICNRLEHVQRDVLVGVQVPTEAEREQGQAVLSGLEAAVAAWEAEGLRGEAVGSPLEAAWRRVEARAQEAGESPSSWLEVVARRQEQQLGAGRLHLAWVLCEALGRLGRREAVPALGRYLWLEADPSRAIAAGRALTRLGAEDLARAAVGRRFPPRSAYAQALRR